MGIQELALFALASAALSVAPGPDNVFVLTHAALHGRKTGIWVTLGLCSGLVVHTIAVALGVAAIFQTSEIAFTALKVIGALYLVFLAFQAFRASSADLGASDGGPSNWRTLYVRGIVMNVANPKVAIFFLAFLPQFADPSSGSLPLQLMILGGIFIVVALVIFSTIAWFAGYIGEWLRTSARAQRIMNRMAGAVFVGLALRLAVTEQSH